MAYRDLIRADTPSLYWPLDATYGITDQSTNGRDGTGAGSIVIGGSAGSPIGGESTSTAFVQANTDRINQAYIPFTNSAVRSFEGWANRTASSDADTLLGSAAASGSQVILRLQSGSQDVFFGAQGAVTGTVTWTAAWPGNGSWVHWVLVFDESADAASLYINGALVSTQTTTRQYNASPGALRVGIHSSSLSDPFAGAMAHLAIYERALTAAEVRSHYLGGSAGTNPVVTNVRELPPTRLHVLATTPNGNTFRWGKDERRPENCYSGLSFSTTIPGGFESMDCNLPRKAGTNYQDLTRLSTVQVKGAGGSVRGEYRLEKTPRVSSETERSINPQLVGWQAGLEDDTTAAEVYVDRDLTHWIPASRALKIALYALAVSVINDPEVSPDTTTGIPALTIGTQGTGSAVTMRAVAFYDAGPGSTIGSIYYDMTSQGTVAGDTGQIGTSSDDITTATSLSSDLLTGSNSSASGTFTPSPTTYRYALVQYSTAQTAEADHVMMWRRLTHWGNHGLTKQGTAPADGLYASDVIANAVSRWAPKLSFTTGPDGTIKPTSFIIPQLEFRELTTAAEIITQANRFSLGDWAVWENPSGPAIAPTFYYNDRGARGKKWRARVRPANLTETGPQVDRLWNGVIVRFSDVDGTTKTVGPTGTLCDSTDAVLLDTDPLNPVNQLGIKRNVILEMGIVSTVAGATEVGRQFLVRSKDLDQSGSAELVGHVQDDRGAMHPASQVRAGDQISFTDASDTSYRRIVHTTYDDDSRTNSIDLDSPPEGLDSLLERLSVSLYGGTPAPPGAPTWGAKPLTGGAPTWGS